MHVSSRGDLVGSTEDACVIKFKLRTINIILATFIIFSLSAGLSTINRELFFEPRDDVPFLVVWNGNLPTFCRNETAATPYPSLYKRFELEPYVKLGFRFALMFTATARAFCEYCRFKIFEFKSSPNDGQLFGFLYQLPVVLLPIQLILGGCLLIISFQIDFNDLPFYNFTFIWWFMLVTGMYMFFTVLRDLRQARTLLEFLRSPLYVARLLTGIIFGYCAFRSFNHISTYSLPLPCNHFADSLYDALLEYGTGISILAFHFTEFFELNNVCLYVFETKYLSVNVDLPNTH